MLRGRTILADQGDWAFCEKCYGLFFNGYEYKGKCPAGGVHKKPQTGMGYNYQLNHSIPGNQYSQPQWEFCVKCHVMFFNGYSGGNCPKGGKHERHEQAYHFVLKHDPPQIYSNEQPYWEFCTACDGLFYNGFTSKGRCPGTIYAIRPGGDRVYMGSHGRHQNAYHFVLRFATPAPPLHVPNYACGWPPNPSVCPGYWVIRNPVIRLIVCC